MPTYSFVSKTRLNPNFLIQIQKKLVLRNVALSKD